jgi:hypothetical protein
MKHFEFKNMLRGASSPDAPKPKPAYLIPPELGDYSVLSSFSFSEVIDLISDGPIKGLVNQNGYPLPNEYLLQGVYLDGIPVEESQENFLIPFDELVEGGENGQIDEFQQPILTKALEDLFIATSSVSLSNNEGVDENQSSSYIPTYYQLDQYITGTSRFVAQPITALAVFGVSYNGSIIELTQDGDNLLWENNYAGTAANNFDDAHDISVSYEEEGDARPGFWKLIAVSDKYDGTGWYKPRIYNPETEEIEDAPYGDPANPFGGYTGYPQDNLATITVDGRGGGYDITQDALRPVDDFYTETVELPGYETETTLENADKITGSPIYSISGGSDYVFNYGISVNEVDELFNAGSGNAFYDGVTELLNITSVGQPGQYEYLSYRLSEYGFDLSTETFDENAIKSLLKANNNTDFDGWYSESQSQDRLGPFICIKIQGQLEAYQNNPQTNLFQNENNTAVSDKSRLVLDAFQNITIDEINARTLNLLVPEMDAQGVWNGNVKGFYLVEFGFLKKLKQGTTGFITPYADRFVGRISKKDVQFLITNKGFKVYSLKKSGLDEEEEVLLSPSRYNYSNILCEFKNGLQDQESLSYFKDVFVDFPYEARLWGPFRNVGQVEKIVQSEGMLKPVGRFNLSNAGAINGSEGSNDNRSDRESSNRSFSDWDGKAANFEETAQGLTHVIYNNNVNQVFFTLRLNALSDTVHQDIGNPEKPTFRAGTIIPGTMNFQVEVGYVDDLGAFETTLKVCYKISSLIQQTTLLDIGNPDNRQAVNDFDFLTEICRNDESSRSCNAQSWDIFDPFPLPPADTPFDPNDTSRSEDTKRKRFLRVTRLSTETASILIKKEMSLLKVTEMMPLRMRYPFSSVVGTKIDSRSFDSPPQRTFDCKLKVVKVPSNYFPTDQVDKDLRYWDKSQDIINLSEEDRRIYKGDWDGTFKYEWTDNPAWILYDIITSSRYGLGEHLREEQVNKWDLYKIARFCDSVDEDGVYQGVDDGRGGLEPRFACNIMFTQGTRIFDSINTIASIFRGFVYYQNSEISFSDDRIKEPIAVFTNSMIENGEFTYSNLKRDEKFNSIEVPYTDKYEGFRTKVEYVEDERDVSKRGTFKKTVNGFGITSKSQANRLARHVLFQGTQEDQTIAFNVGLESLLVSPGDLVVIEDDLKSLSSNFGRVLEVDTGDYSIRTTQPFVDADYEDRITLFVPTARQSVEEVSSLTGLVRSRVYGFNLNSNSDQTFDDSFPGSYSFEGYKDGYEDVSQFPLQNQYAFYKGGVNDSSFVWFNTDVTGWVFSTGAAFTDNDIYNQYIVNSPGIFDFSDITSPIPGQESDSDIMFYDNNQETRRGTLAFGGEDLFRNNANDLNYTEGVSEADIDLTSATQIYDFTVTGTNAKEFGDKVYIDQNDPNINLLQFVPKGTSYRFKSKNKDDQVYKIVGIREEADNKYTVEGVKYVLDRYEQIEEPGTIEDPLDTYGYNQEQFSVIDTDYIKIPEPSISLSQGYDNNYNNYISATWNSAIGATGYHVEFLLPNGSRLKRLDLQTTSCILDDLYSIGKYKCRVQAKGLSYDNQNMNVRYYDSDIGEQNIQIVDLQNQANQGDPSLISDMDILLP